MYNRRFTTRFYNFYFISKDVCRKSLIEILEISTLFYFWNNVDNAMETFIPFSKYLMRPKMSSKKN